MNINNDNFYNDNNKKSLRTVLWGDRLRQARESLGLSQQNIANSLCLKLSIIKSIEEGYLDNLKISSTFLYGYVRSYARLVGMNLEEIVVPISDGLYSVPSVHNKIKCKFFQWKCYKDKIKLLIILCFIFCLFVIVLSVMWYLRYFFIQRHCIDTSCFKPVSFFINNEHNRNRLVIFAEQNIFHRHLDVVFNNISDISYKGYLNHSIFYFPEIFNKVSSDIKKYSLYDDMVFFELGNNNINVTNNIHGTDDVNTIVMSFISDCWIDVYDATGTRLYVGTQYSGNVLNLRGQIPYKLIIGAPQSVEIKYQGNVVNLEKFIHPYKVARLSIPNE